jgi:hypothetical protein
VKEVNAEQIEQWTKEQITKLGADGELLDSCIAAANAGDEQRTGPLRTEQTELLRRINEVRGKVDRLGAAIADGARAFRQSGPS